MYVRTSCVSSSTDASNRAQTQQRRARLYCRTAGMFPRRRQSHCSSRGFGPTTSPQTEHLKRPPSTSRVIRSSATVPPVLQPMTTANLTDQFYRFAKLAIYDGQRFRLQVLRSTAATRTFAIVRVWHADPRRATHARPPVLSTSEAPISPTALLLHSDKRILAISRHERLQPVGWFAGTGSLLTIRTDRHDHR